MEGAFQNGSENVRLDQYRIDLKNFIQVRLDDDTKQRPVKREVETHSNDRVLPHRFYDPLPLQILGQKSSTYAPFDAWCPFLKAWLQSALGKRVLLDFQACIELCAQGIIQETLNHDDSSRAKAAEIAATLRQCFGKSRREVSEVCMAFYTQENFLYRVLNMALRECDLTKLKTLGPYAYLLSNHVRTCKEYCGTVYRGADLDATHVEAYRMALGQWKSWPAYTSTSRVRDIADMFGNTLFAIDITGPYPTSPRAFDVSGLSEFPGEAEVVIPPGISFRIVSVNRNHQQKHIIELRI